MDGVKLMWPVLEGRLVGVSDCCIKIWGFV